MGLQVVSFPRRSERNYDWTRDELAELYRIEHALVQGNIRVETDRGLTDEGDPWFVFCRTDGEVLVHISRYDGLYRLYSPGLANSLVGRSFADLTKSFVRQVPVQVSVQHRDGAKLFVHPAAMLAVIIGTLFAASNDLHLFSSSSETGQHTDNGYDHGSLKHTLQATFASYIETFLCSLRDAPILQQSSYLSLISAVAVFIIESTIGVADQSPNGIVGANITADGGGQADSTSPQHNAPVAPSVADDSVSSHKVAINENSIEQTTADTAAQQSSGDDVNHGTVHQVLAINNLQPASGPVAGNEYASSPTAFESVPIANDLTVEDNAGHFVRLATLVPSASNANSSAAGSSAMPAANSGVSAEPSQPDASHQTTPSSGDISGLLAVDVSGLLANALNNTANNLQLDAISVFLNIGHVTSDIAAVTAVANPAVASTSTTVQQIPTFNAAAEATLVAFFTANPNAEATFYNGNIVVSDNIQSPTDPVIIKIWEVGSSGDTIAIVGHADHGLNA